jgi:hypothetical protein
MEGQQDHWYVAAWLPAWLLVAAGLARCSAVPGACLAGLALVWSIGANARDLDFRGYRLAEIYADLLLGPLPRGAILVVGSDDAASTTFHAQEVRGFRTDVRVVRAAHLGEPGSWYDRVLAAKDPSLRPATYARRPGPRRSSVAADFAAAQVSAGREVFLDLPVPGTFLPQGLILAAYGPLQQVVPVGRTPSTAAPIGLEPLEVRKAFRRARGVRGAGPDGRRPREPYERRLLILLLRARLEEAEASFRAGDAGPAYRAFSSILEADPESADQPEVAFPMGILLAGMGRTADAESFFQRSLARDEDPFRKALACAQLGLLAAATGRPGEALAWRDRALATPGLTPEMIGQLQRMLVR